MSRVAEVFNLAWKHHQALDFARAEELYLQILQTEPNHADANCFLAGVYHSQGKLAPAEQYLRRALQLVPDYATAQNLLGIVLAEQGRLEESELPFREVLRRDPNNAETHNNLGNLLVSMGRYSEAIGHCRRALVLMPGFAGAHNNLGNALRQKGESDEAVYHFERALHFQPSIAEAHLNLGSVRHNQLRLADAEAHYQAALRLRPSNKVRVVLASLLPPVYQSKADMLQRRQRLVENIQQLKKEKVLVDLAKDEPSVDLPTLFYLPYHGMNDRDIQRDFASLFLPLQAPPVAARPGGSRTSEKIRLGFVSRFFKNHTIGRLMQGMIANISRDDFEVTVLSIGNHQDDLGRFIQQHCDQYVPLPTNPVAALPLVAQQQLDVLFYTDLGMEHVSYVLAQSRLAPVQCVTWGHPDTTGIRTIDYFISTEALETAEADQHYTEKLVRLKTLPVHYYRPQPPVPLKGKEYFGFAGDDHLYACPQSLFKFHTEFDEILSGILRGDPRGKLVLLQGLSPAWVELLRKRFTTTMPDCMDRIRFLAPLGLPDFLNLMAVADVLLDPLHFGGGNTSYEGLAAGSPIVTLPSQFMRGRYTFALYKQMQVLECVVHNTQEYIQLALRLGNHADFREMMHRKILDANSVIFGNNEGIRDLEGFLKRTVNEIRNAKSSAPK